jgi:hypothetical protein
MSADTNYLHSLLDDAGESIARQAGTIRAQDKKIREQAAEIERLRAALIAAMEIVQRERVRTVEKAKNGASPNILNWLDAVIAQADAALGEQK